MKQWQQIAMRDSKLESPKEICGLVVNVKGKEVFFNCPNRSKDEDNFILDPDSYAICEEQGQIVGIFHSHPKGSSKNSSAVRDLSKSFKFIFLVSLYQSLKNV